ncbi:MAG: polynucleotide kinase-phosphatase [Synergistaceae bacterium]|jgi:protein phosphatase|nr:polynucleotide kinase-phosphatase [Synergistaceae bacterium]
MRIEIPDLSVVTLVGASGSGKSTFAARFFKPTEVLSSDFFRGMVSDDESDQNATKDAFDVLYYAADKRLSAGKLVVIDATNVQKEARAPTLELARRQDVHAVAIVLDVPEELCQERNKANPARNYPPHVIRNHSRALRQSIKHLRKEGFRYIHVLKSPEELDAVEVVRVPLWNDKREEKGPFDIIGDVHGCFDELCELLEKLGYTVDANGRMALWEGEPRRKAVFLGDFCDRGEKNADVLRLVMNMAALGLAFCLPGNHDVKLLKYLEGAKVEPAHGLGKTIAELEGETPEFRENVRKFLDSLVSHYVLDGGKLVVAHAGLREKFQGRASGRVRSFCLYGETTGDRDEFGLPERMDWTEEYRGRAAVVYGHVASEDVRVLNGTFGIDTGCVFGGRLTAMRWPERDIIAVEAKREYYAPAKPLVVLDERGYFLDAKDVAGKRRISTSLFGGVLVKEENAAAAFEIMSRFAADPRWLVYLPPTMSPCAASPLEDCLEQPAEAFEYFRSNGIENVICEEKHMGSRAVIIVCRSEKAAASRFGVGDGSRGIVYSRTGRHFFEAENEGREGELLARLGDVLSETNFWEDFSTDWVCLDAELMPWSAKAQKLLSEQYAAAGEAGRLGLSSALRALERAKERGVVPLGVKDVKKGTSGMNVDVGKLLEKYRAREAALTRYTEAYRRYCWPSPSLDDLRVAPFHVLATEDHVWKDTDHAEHMRVVEKYAAGRDPIFIATNHLLVTLGDERSVQTGVSWWTRLTESGGEGMVVKPLGFAAKRGSKLLQPAVKCRGREYLRIIYGPEYTESHHMTRLKKRSLGKKGRLALDEFALGMEALDRFVRREPLYRVHECVFGVLALESEPVDPRL